MSIGSICKKTAVVLFVLDIIVTIFLTIASGNLLILIFGVFGGFIPCLLIYAVGEIIDILEEINENTNEIFSYLKKNDQKDEVKKESGTTYFSAPVKTADGGWICKKCGTKNDSSSQYCKDCGEYK